MLSRGSSILALCTTRRPSAIPRCVWSIIVNAVQLEPVRAWTHIRQKAQEIIAPFVTHRNPATAIVVIASIFRLIAAILGSAPRRVFSRAFLSMLEEQPPRHFFGKASATFSATAHEMVATYDSPIAADAAAEPLDVIVSSVMKGNDGQSSELSSSKVFKVVGVFGRFLFSHDASRGVVVRAANQCDQHWRGSLILA